LVFWVGVYTFGELQGEHGRGQPSPRQGWRDALQHGIQSKTRELHEFLRHFGNDTPTEGEKSEG